MPAIWLGQLITCERSAPQKVHFFAAKEEDAKASARTSAAANAAPNRPARHTVPIEVLTAPPSPLSGDLTYPLLIILVGLMALGDRTRQVVSTPSSTVRQDRARRAVQLRCSRLPVGAALSGSPAVEFALASRIPGYPRRCF